MAANPNANVSANRVLEFLQELASQERVISGQNVTRIGGAAGGYASYVTELHAQVGGWVGLIGSDYGHGATPDAITTGNGVLIDHWNRGGLVTVSHHANNPWTGGNAWDTTQRDLLRLCTPGTQVNRTWMAQLDRLAAGLTELRDAGVVVLWRPFHEMTFNNTFWWDISSHNGDPEPFKTMWRHMFDYFTNEKGLNNLLWVYSTANSDNYNRVDVAYPGAEYVDVVGIDVYSDTVEIRGDGYNRLLATGKPFAMTELGPQLRDGSYDNLTTLSVIRDRYPRTAYFLQWHSWGDNRVAIVDNRNAAGLMTDAWVVNRDELERRLTSVAPASLVAALAEIQTVAADLRGTADRLEAQMSAIQSDLARIRRFDQAFDALAAWARDLTDDV